MPILQTSRDIRADIDTVYELAKNVEDFPTYMKDVKSVQVLERSEDGTRTVTDWVGVVEQFRQTVHWIEEDLWDDRERTCRFRQLKGDYSSYSGEWRFVETPTGTRFESTLQFEYNIPLIGPLIQNVIAKLMRENLENTLKAIAEQAEAAAKQPAGSVPPSNSPASSAPPGAAADH